MGLLLTLGSTLSEFNVIFTSSWETLLNPSLTLRSKGSFPNVLTSFQLNHLQSSNLPILTPLSIMEVPVGIPAELLGVPLSITGDMQGMRTVWQREALGTRQRASY